MNRFQIDTFYNVSASIERNPSCSSKNDFDIDDLKYKEIDQENHLYEDKIDNSHPDQSHSSSSSSSSTSDNSNLNQKLQSNKNKSVTDYLPNGLTISSILPYKGRSVSQSEDTTLTSVPPFKRRSLSQNEAVNVNEDVLIVPRVKKKVTMVDVCTQTDAVRRQSRKGSQV